MDLFRQYLLQANEFVFKENPTLVGWETFCPSGGPSSTGCSPFPADWDPSQQMTLSVCSGCHQSNALSHVAKKQTPAVLTDQRKSLCSCPNETFRQEVQKKIAMPVGMRNREWEGGSSLIMMSAGGQSQVEIKKKNGMMSFFTGTFHWNEIRSHTMVLFSAQTRVLQGITLWSCFLGGV